MYDDAFTLQEVTDEEIERYNFTAGFLPLIMNLEKDVCYNAQDHIQKKILIYFLILSAIDSGPASDTLA